MRRDNRSALRAERVESRPKFSERDGVLVDAEAPAEVSDEAAAAREKRDKSLGGDA